MQAASHIEVSLNGHRPLHGIGIDENRPAAT
jgi:hypothetical protein